LSGRSPNQLLNFELDNPSPDRLQVYLGCEETSMGLFFDSGFRR
jgi:hypothetical protein